MYCLKLFFSYAVIWIQKQIGILGTWSEMKAIYNNMTQVWYWYIGKILCQHITSDILRSTDLNPWNIHTISCIHNTGQFIWYIKPQKKLNKDFKKVMFSLIGSRTFHHLFVCIKGQIAKKKKNLHTLLDS